MEKAIIKPTGQMLKLFINGKLVWDITPPNYTKAANVLSEILAYELIDSIYYLPN